MTNNVQNANLLLDVRLESSERGGVELTNLTGFTRLDDGRDLAASGLQAQAYVNDSTREIVLVYAGVNDWASSDSSAVLGYSNGSLTQQHVDSLNYANDISIIVNDPDSIFVGYDVSVLGYSLGGGHAQVVHGELVI